LKGHGFSRAVSLTKAAQGAAETAPLQGSHPPMLEFFPQAVSVVPIKTDKDAGFSL
jgi:hypothetical protein